MFQYFELQKIMLADTTHTNGDRLVLLLTSDPGEWSFRPPFLHILSPFPFSDVLLSLPSVSFHFPFFPHFLCLIPLSTGI